MLSTKLRFCALAEHASGSSIPIKIKAVLSMQLIISQVLARYGNALAALGEGQARTALSHALNHEGRQRTQVKRALVKQTGIKYGAVNKVMATARTGILK